MKLYKFLSRLFTAVIVVDLLAFIKIKTKVISSFIS